MLRAAGLAVTPDMARIVAARSTSNPLYVTTLARLLASEPETALDEHALSRIVGASAEVSGLVRSLLSGLDPGAVAVLAAASVVGEAFDPALVATVGPPMRRCSARWPPPSSAGWSGRCRALRFLAVHARPGPGRHLRGHSRE